MRECEENGVILHSGVQLGQCARSVAFNASVALPGTPMDEQTDCHPKEPAGALKAFFGGEVIVVTIIDAV